MSEAGRLTFRPPYLLTALPSYFPDPFTLSDRRRGSGVGGRSLAFLFRPRERFPPRPVQQVRAQRVPFREAGVLEHAIRPHAESAHEPPRRTIRRCGEGDHLVQTEGAEGGAQRQ